jgi:hypothetical protein
MWPTSAQKAGEEPITIEEDFGYKRIHRSVRHPASISRVLAIHSLEKTRSASQREVAE